MTRISLATNTALVLYRPKNLLLQRPFSPTPSVSTEGSSTLSLEHEPTSATLAERASFYAGRAWNFLTDDVADLKGFKHSVGRLPPPDWYDRFTSDSSAVRAEAYWANRDGQVGLFWLTDWEDFTSAVVRLQETKNIIKLHFVLSRLFGGVPYQDMREAAYAKELKMGPERVKRHYVAQILSVSFNTTQQIPGWVHEKEAGYVVGQVKAAREMYHAIGVCLDHPGVRRKLALVPKKFYADLFPKKSAESCEPGARGGVSHPSRPVFMAEFQCVDSEDAQNIASKARRTWVNRAGTIVKKCYRFLAHVIGFVAFPLRWLLAQLTAKRPGQPKG